MGFIRAKAEKTNRMGHQSVPKAQTNKNEANNVYQVLGEEKNNK